MDGQRLTSRARLEERKEEIAFGDSDKVLIFVPPWELVSHSVIKKPGGEERALGLWKLVTWITFAGCW